jgi:hypothetical protein
MVSFGLWRKGRFVGASALPMGSIGLFLGVVLTAA